MAKQLLVVDDDPGLLLAVSETLRAEGYEVQTARRGSEAMIRVAESLPDPHREPVRCASPQAAGVAAAFVGYHQHYRISFFWSGGSLRTREALACWGSLTTLGGLRLAESGEPLSPSQGPQRDAGAVVCS